MIQRLEIEQEAAIITDTAIIEVVWVLQSRYKTPKREVISALEVMAGSLGVQFCAPVRFYGALTAYAAGKGDFADYLLREQARDSGCRAVATFDKALLKDDGFIEP